MIDPRHRLERSRVGQDHHRWEVHLLFPAWPKHQAVLHHLFLGIGLGATAIRELVMPQLL